MDPTILPLPPTAHVVYGDVIHFGDAHAEAQAALHEDILTPLSHLSLLRASGAESDSFLQGQLSNDLRKLSADRAQLAAYSSPKGRMLAVFHLSRDPEGAAWMEVHRSIEDIVAKRLKMFVMRAKVELQNASEEYPALGLAGPEAAAILQSLSLPAPSAADAVETADQVQVIRRAGTIPRYSLRAAPAKLTALWPSLAERARPAGTAAWRLLDILAGVPVVYPETQDHFVAQMANLDKRSGISFDKGCYTGQEVIARLHHLGTLKRRLFLAKASAEAISPGTNIHAQGEAQSAGEVVDAAPTSQVGMFQLSFVLQLAHSDSALCLGAPDGVPLIEVRPAD